MNPILIEIRQDRPGFDRFIGSWVCVGHKNIVVDVGPASSVSRLIESLKAMGLDRIDYILLTHIHIDHAGGLADFLQHFPMAGVICHSKGVKHLIEPSKLWAGSRKVLGEIAEFYGALKPVKEEKLIPHTEASINGLEIIETPGHAPHHLSFLHEGNLFAGEAGGNYFSVGGRVYLRPATPSRFFLEQCLASADSLMALEDRTIYYSHFGSAESSHHMLKRFRDQLIRWEEIIREEMNNGERHLMERCMAELLDRDPELKAFSHMGPDDQKREEFFMTNSLHGYIEFLKSE